MNRRVTIRDVANEAGVSIGLVSMVLHSNIGTDGKPDCNVRVETARRIQNAIDKLGYIPNNAAATMRSGRSSTIAVITSDISSRFFSKICRHIETLSYEQGYNAIFASSDENSTKFTTVIDSAIRMGVDGMIILPPPHANSALGKLSRFKIPVVFLERDVPGFPGAGHVLLDNALAIKLSVDELVSNGYRRIELIADDMDITTISDRVESYKIQMSANGLENEACVNFISHDAGVDEMCSLIKTAINRGTEAFVLPSNRMTELTIMALDRMSLRVPQDIAYVGFNRSDLYSLAKPSPTYIYESTKRLGSAAFSLLIDMIEEKEEPKSIVLKPTLVSGESSIRLEQGEHN